MKPFTQGVRSPAEILVEAARRYGDKTALITADRTLSYSELDELSNSVAAALGRRGVLPGDRVSLYSQNRWEWIVSYHGALKAGAVVNPVNVMLTPAELEFVLLDCESTALFASADKLELLGDIADQVPSLRHVVTFDSPTPSQIAFDDLTAEPGSTDFVPHSSRPLDASTIGYTSGTTGTPKGAVQSHQAVFLNCKCAADMHNRTASDTVVTALPAPHVYGNVVINSTFMTGGTVVLMERFSSNEALNLIEQHSATLFEGVPAMYGMLLAEPDIAQRNLFTITRSTVGGQTISTATIDAWQRITGAPLLEVWGMTEISGLGATHWHNRPLVPGSIGVPLDVVDLRITDSKNPELTMPTGEPGQLMVRGPLVMLEYFGNPQATREAFTEDGWMQTGDIAYVDEAGYYYVVDRLKDMIITAGYNVYPAEIERVIATHPDVAIVAVAAVPDAIKGELACAYIVPKPNTTPTESDILDYCRDRLAPYKRPRSVAFVPSLPQTSTGKIMRRALAATSSSSDPTGM